VAQVPEGGGSTGVGCRRREGAGGSACRPLHAGSGAVLHSCRQAPPLRCEAVPQGPPLLLRPPAQFACHSTNATSWVPHLEKMWFLSTLFTLQLLPFISPFLRLRPVT
jgi:hypothetical protein